MKEIFKIMGKARMPAKAITKMKEAGSSGCTKRVISAVTIAVALTILMFALNG